MFCVVDKAQVFFYSEGIMLTKFLHYLLKNQIIFALFIIVVVWFMLQIKSIIASIFIAYIIMAALLPLVEFLMKKGLPKIVSVLIAYTSIMFIGFLIIFPLIPFFISQVQSLLIGFPVYVYKSATTLGLPIDTARLQTYIAQEIDIIGANAFSVTKQVFGGLFSLLTILIVSFYLLLNHESFKLWIAKVFHVDDREKVYQILKNVDNKLGAWLRGQLLLCYIICILTWLALTIINMPYALPLALIAGILEAFPTIGPILSAIPAVIVALTISPTTALIVILVYTIIQLLENNVIVPKVMEQAVGLNPIVIIIAVSTGSTLMGITGALLSIPFISFLVVLFNSIRNSKISTLRR